MRQVRWRVGVSFGIAVGLLAVLGILFVRLVVPEPGYESLRQANSINLALRRTAHHLLRVAGDSTSRIPAIQQASATTYRLPLNAAFSYDALPALLQQSLRLYQISLPYEVAVLDCGTQRLQLGYSQRDLLDSKTVPCTGRTLAPGCYVLQVTFAAPPPPASASYWPVLAVVGLLAGMMAVVWRRVPASPVAAPTPVGNPVTKLQFGHSVLEVNRQMLVAGSTTHNLTYRETKLLHLLASHPNQIMERNLILKRVWGDEGIFVSRSVDVFVSRLRKLLSTDPTVRINAVHGVGYRLEVQENLQG